MTTLLNLHGFLSKKPRSSSITSVDRISHPSTPVSRHLKRWHLNHEASWIGNLGFGLPDLSTTLLTTLAPTWPVTLQVFPLKTVMCLHCTSTLSPCRHGSTENEAPGMLAAEILQHINALDFKMKISGWIIPLVRLYSIMFLYIFAFLDVSWPAHFNEPTSFRTLPRVPHI
jgi:hypothetical protein